MLPMYVYLSRVILACTCACVMGLAEGHQPGDTLSWAINRSSNGKMGSSTAFASGNHRAIARSPSITTLWRLSRYLKLRSVMLRDSERVLFVFLCLCC